MPTSFSWLPFLCVNVLFAGAALSLGFFAGAWFLGGRRREPDGDDGDAERRALERQLTLAKSERLRELAIGVVSEIGEHTTRVRVITANLQALDLNDFEATGAGLVAAMAEIIAANNNLQQQLSVAEAQIKAQAEEIRDFEIESRTDSLTGLANRRAFDDELARRFSEWQRKGTQFSLLIMDLDHYKQFNDNFGHQTGDEVLRRVGKQLQLTCRGMDLPCRYGGEEFAVVMPATAGIETETSAERLRQVIEEMDLCIDGKKLNITCSIGVAEVIRSDDMASIVKRADAALYRSKRAGRNCGHLHNGIECVPLLGPSSAKPRVPQPPTSHPPATQSLDNLSNRTRFIEDLRRRIAECQRSNSPLAVMTVKIGAGEEIKQSRGPAAFNLTLDQIAHCLMSTFRKSDHVARLNEQTFVVLMPGTRGSDLHFVGERVERALDGLALADVDGPENLRVALGISTLQPVDTAESLIRRAEVETFRMDDPIALANGAR